MIWTLLSKSWKSITSDRTNDFKTQNHWTEAWKIKRLKMLWKCCVHIFYLFECCVLCFWFLYVINVFESHILIWNGIPLIWMNILSIDVSCVRCSIYRYWIKRNGCAIRFGLCHSESYVAWNLSIRFVSNSPFH